MSNEVTFNLDVVIKIPNPYAPGSRIVLSCSRCLYGSGEFIIGYNMPAPENISPLNGHYVCNDCVRALANPGA